LEDESRYHATIQDHEDIRNGYLRWTSKLYDPIRDFVKENGWQALFECYGSTNVFEIVQEQWAIMDSIKSSKVPNQFEGVPQGSPTSPILSILLLSNFLKQQLSTSYADDPVFYSDKDFEIKDEP